MVEQPPHCDLLRLSPFDRMICLVAKTFLSARALLPWQQQQTEAPHSGVVRRWLPTGGLMVYPPVKHLESGCGGVEQGSPPMKCPRAGHGGVRAPAEQPAGLSPRGLGSGDPLVGRPCREGALGAAKSQRWTVPLSDGGAVAKSERPRAGSLPLGAWACVRVQEGDRCARLSPGGCSPRVGGERERVWRG